MKSSILTSLRNPGKLVTSLLGAVTSPIAENAASVRKAVVGTLILASGLSAARAQTHPAEDSTHFVHLMAPVGGQHFCAPGLLRVFLSASDTGNWPDQNRAASVDVMVDDTVQTTIPGGQSEYWVYKTNLTGITAGSHRI